ncbi:hypothetical protein Tco_1502897 [Tanacetum coccineum]
MISFTMKMEILLESTSNKLMVGYLKMEVKASCDGSMYTWIMGLILTNVYDLNTASGICNLVLLVVKIILLAQGVNCCTNASGSQPRSNTRKNRIYPAKGVYKKKVEEHPRINKSNLRTTNHVDSSSSSKRTVINSNSDSVCQTCNKCLISANHDVCVVDYLQSVKASPSIHNIHNVVRKVKQVWKPKQVRQVWKPTGKVLTSVGHQWRPTGRIFTLGE